MFFFVSEQQNKTCFCQKTQPIFCATAQSVQEVKSECNDKMEVNEVEQLLDNALDDIWEDSPSTEED